jgi:hypothetical protein
MQEITTQYHFPGYNYLGPGTHVLNNVTNHIAPVNSIDAVARSHDIDYATGVDPIYADIKAIGRSFASSNPVSHLLRTGLAIRTIWDAALRPTIIPNIAKSFASGNYSEADKIYLRGQDINPITFPY